MDFLLFILLFVNAYLIVFLRLNIKYYYEKTNDLKESNLGAILSLPPYSKLPEKGKTYCKRYWMAIVFMFACVAFLVSSRDYSFLKTNAVANQANIEQTILK